MWLLSEAYLDTNFQNKKINPNCFFVAKQFGFAYCGGPGGSRTRVRKPIDTTFSVGRVSIKNSLQKRRQTGFLSGSSFMRGGYKCEITTHVHHSVTPSLKP